MYRSTCHLTVIMATAQYNTTDIYNDSKAAVRNLDKKLNKILASQKDTHIGLFGDTGAGKSSFINTVAALFRKNKSSSDESDESDEDDEVVATAPDDIQTGHTLRRKEVKLTDHMTIFDNRGWHDFT